MEGLSARSFADALDYLNEGKASRTVSQKIQAAYGIEDLRSQMDVLAGLVVNANELLAAAKEDPLTANYPPVLDRAPWRGGNRVMVLDVFSPRVGADRAQCRTVC